MRSSVLALRIRLHGDSKSRDEYSWEAFQCSVTESTLDRTSVRRSSVQRYDRDSFASRVFPVHAHRCRPRNHHLLRAFQLCEDAPWRRIREERTEREREREESRIDGGRGWSTRTFTSTREPSLAIFLGRLTSRSSSKIANSSLSLSVSLAVVASASAVGWRTVSPHLYPPELYLNPTYCNRSFRSHDTYTTDDDGDENDDYYCD